MNEVEKVMAKKMLKRLKKNWHEIRYDEIRNKPYLIGKRTESSKTQAVSVLNSVRTLTIQDLKNRIEDSGISSTVLAVRSSDSSTVFYSAQLGLNSPLAQESSENASSEESSENEVLDIGH
ncbi:uncharacterized protein LOC118203204 [Stegodyphus dumicola]|uniref:uncharacterized protein LOC118203204 n=1 Tax=Stegodyphus dumicola TaxID=202533 RepID=UPI0015ABC071|nr:uncharacterized protein LOC118203204 [Stegodyphus dumicola]